MAKDVSEMELVFFGPICVSIQSPLQQFVKCSSHFFQAQSDDDDGTADDLAVNMDGGKMDEFFQEVMNVANDLENKFEERAIFLRRSMRYLPNGS